MHTCICVVHVIMIVHDIFIDELSRCKMRLASCSLAWKALAQDMMSMSTSQGSVFPLA